MLDLFKSNLVEPDVVEVPNQDAVETVLQYSTPFATQAPTMDGLLHYINQETARMGTVNKYYTTTRRTYNIIQSDLPLFVIDARA